MISKKTSSYSEKSVFKKRGYMPLKRYTKTLQGSLWIVWKVSPMKTKYIPENCQQIAFRFINRFAYQFKNDMIIPLVPQDLINLIMLYWGIHTQMVKVVDKSLHKNSIALVNGNPVHVAENVLQETGILQYLSDNKQHSLIQYKDFFYDKYNYFLVMEHGGESLFYFVRSHHKLIKEKLIDITEWHSFCRNAMKQMVDVLEWMHNVKNSCHLDVSLENFTIQNIKKTIIVVNNQKKIIFCPNFQIKLIDFGLAEVFSTKKDDGCIDFRCDKYVGKKPYKSFKVYGKKEIFDARRADCWALSVCYFMMFFGCGPWTRPSYSDLSFWYIMNGQLIELLESWDLLDYTSVEMLDLLVFGLFNPYEKHRFTMKDIQKHCWFN